MQSARYQNFSNVITGQNGAGIMKNYAKGANGAGFSPIQKMGQNGAGVWKNPYKTQQQKTDIIRKSLQMSGAGMQKFARQSADQNFSDLQGMAQQGYNTLKQGFNNMTSNPTDFSQRLVGGAENIWKKLSPHSFSDITKTPLYSDVIKPFGQSAISKVQTEISKPKSKIGGFFSRIGQGIKKVAGKVINFIKPIAGIAQKVAPAIGGIIGGPGGAAIGTAIGKGAGFINNLGKSSGQ